MTMNSSKGCAAGSELPDEFQHENFCNIAAAEAVDQEFCRNPPPSYDQLYELNSSPATNGLTLNRKRCMLVLFHHTPLELHFPFHSF